MEIKINQSSGSLNKIYLFLVMIIIVIIAYLYLRNVNIRRFCENQALLESVITYKITDYPDTEERNRLQNLFKQDYVINCINNQNIL